MIKNARRILINYGKLRECNANLYNLYYNLNEWDLCIDRSNDNDRVFTCRLTRMIFHTWQCVALLNFSQSSREICHGYVSGKYRLYTEF